MAPELGDDGKVVDESPPSVMPAERRPDQDAAGLSTETQARIAFQVGPIRGLVITFSDFDSITSLPKRDDGVEVRRDQWAKMNFNLHMPITEYTYYRMNLSALKTNLRQHADLKVRLVLPDGDPIPAEFHVTEVGHVVKHFIDCGGTVRRVETCLLQTWVSDHDADHRLSAAKLAKILDLAAKVLPSDDLDVEVEYEPCCVAQYKVDHAEVVGDELRFQLAHKHTDCLAREACGLASAGEGCGCGTGSEGGCC